MENLVSISDKVEVEVTGWTLYFGCGTLIYSNMAHKCEKESG